MWGDVRVDVWWYLMLVCNVLASLLFFTRKRRAKALCLCAPLALLFWIAYEQAIDSQLSQNVPIRVDIPVVAFAAFFPLAPTCLYLIRVRRVAREIPPTAVASAPATPDERLAQLLKKP